MTIELNPIVRWFAERSPLPVMARAVLERCLGRDELDAWFDATAQTQYRSRRSSGTATRVKRPGEVAKNAGLQHSSSCHMCA